MNGSSSPVAALDDSQCAHRTLQTDILRLACVSAGVSPPTGEVVHHLDVGCSPGASLDVHAAANPGTFWHAGLASGEQPHASAPAVASGSGGRGSLAAFAACRDLPQFDVIAVQDEWNSIPKRDRRMIVELMRRNLRVGGIVCVNYSCFPGRASVEPLRHLMALHSDQTGSGSAGSAERLQGAVGFSNKIADAGALLFKASPAVSERLRTIAGQPPGRLVDEYLGRGRHLVAFSEVARSLGEAKLDFAAAAHLLDHLDGINLSPEGIRLLAGIPHPVLRQSVRDYLVNQQFRRDVFVKGLRRLTSLERGEALMAQSFILIPPPDDVPLRARAPQGEVILQEHIHRPLIDVLAENHHEPKSLGRLIGHEKLKAIPHAQVIEAALALTGIGHVSTARAPTEASLGRSRAFNQEICQRWRSSSDVAFLASPVTGSGIPIGGLERLFLLGLGQGRSTPRDLAVHARDVLAAQNQRIVEEGKPIEASEHHAAELAGLASLFIDKRLPILKALQVV